jgi:hypothetical protein
VSDWESLRADAREDESDARVRRVNTSRLAGVNSASEEPPSYICEDCGLDWDCACPATTTEVNLKQGGQSNEEHAFIIVAQPRKQTPVMGSAGPA